MPADAYDVFASAHERFTAALDELRRKYVAEFDQWLKARLGNASEASHVAATDRIATARTMFAGEFLDHRAPEIVRSLKPDAEFEVLQLLRTYDAKLNPIAPPAVAVAKRRWLPSLWRTIVAAAFGAATGVLILALQPGGNIKTEPPPKQDVTTQAATQSAPQTDITVQAPEPQQPGPVISLPNLEKQTAFLLLKAAFAAALGATIGVFIIAFPPFHLLLERVGVRGVPLRLMRNFGGAFLFLKFGPVMTLAAVLLSAIFTLIGFVMRGSAPINVAFGVTAVVIVLLARWTAPNYYADDQASLDRTLAAQLDNELKADAGRWAAMSAALMLTSQATASRGGSAQEIINIILARRANKEPADVILPVVEQRLGLVPGTAEPKPATVAEFVWKPEHAHEYETYGVVETNDTVTVTQPPLYVPRTRQVSRRGLVVRKS